MTWQQKFNEQFRFRNDDKKSLDALALRTELIDFISSLLEGLINEIQPPPYDSETSIEQDYENLKQELRKKYGIK